jgi:molybdate transport system substrate-binding protein
MKFRTTAVVAFAAALALAGCSSGKKDATAGGGSITVLAASSLTDTFNEIGTQFMAAHPGVKVTFSYGASSTLATSITQGAPADVFASASPATMKTVTDAGDATGTPQAFVKNQLVIAVAPGNPKGIQTLQDLAKPGLKVVLCAPAVPCGAAATTALAAGNVTVNPVSLGQDVKSTLSPVELGEADAALVYRTDALALQGKVTGIEFPESAQAINSYLIAPLKGSKDAADAQAFVAFVLSPAGMKVLTDAGFQAP